MPMTRIEKSGPVAHLILDDAPEKLNTLGKAMLAELGERIAELKADASVQAIVLRSGKASGFLAGANLNELQALSASPQAAQDGYLAARAGQALMDAIEDCGKPVVAAIHGPALGGGCETALACTARVAATEGVKIGLPEIQLGILPGFGGSWRLPRLLTHMAALPLILASTQLDGRRALKAGLVDDICPLEQLPQVAEALALSLLKAGGKERLYAARRAKQPLVNKIFDIGPLKGIVFSMARKNVLAKTKGAYPAPLKALDVMALHTDHRASCLEREAKGLGELLATDVSRNLVRLFFLGQDAKKQAGGVKGAKIGSVAVVGAGFMGSGIAIPLVTRAKLPTIIKEANLDVLGRALKKVQDYLGKGVAKRRISQAQASQQFDLLSPGAGADLGRVDLVIEAVPEILDLKHKVFAELEAQVPASAILASNTSTLPIADIAAQAKHPERFVGMHFFSPAEVMPLVEIIPSAKTSKEAIATVVELSLKMGKTPVVVKDSPGFLVNRILMPYIIEAAQLVQEGVPVATVDRAALKFGMPVGPIKLMGEVGIPVITHVAKNLQQHFGDHLPKTEWIQREDLGDAFGKDAKGKLTMDTAKIQAWVGKADPGYDPAEIQDRLFLAMLNEGARCLAEGIVPEPGYLDLAMIYGTGFPPYKGGLLREADARGVAACLARAQALAAKAPWLAPSEGLKAAAAKGSFY
jgi:3-hydroxyacyl-CoA dehydrogenase / enoyl-CoA hydratase / 3-hydroxybutyryl-CoA epimerase